MLKKAAALSMVGGIVFVGIAVIVMMVVINDKYQGVGESHTVYAARNASFLTCFRQASHQGLFEFLSALLRGTKKIYYRQHGRRDELETLCR